MPRKTEESLEQTLTKSQILAALTELRDGELGCHLPEEGLSGVDVQIAATFNEHVRHMNVIADEYTRIFRELGTEGRFGGQAECPGGKETWKDLTDNVNFMARMLTDQVRDVATNVTAKANGNFDHRVTVECRGEIAELKLTLNIWGDQLKRNP